MLPSRLIDCSKSFSTLLISLLVLLPTAAVIAGTSSPKYDVRTEAKMKGSVDEVQLPANAKDIVHLLVKTDAGTTDVYLCPKSFLDDMGVTFTKGDQIVLTGSKVKQGDADLVLAREVVRGTDDLVLRDGKGNPVWV